MNCGKRLTLIQMVLLALTLALTSPLAAQDIIPDGLTLEPMVEAGGQVVAIRAAHDGSGRLFLVRQSGEIRVYDTANQTLLSAPFLTITDRVADGGERGLLGLAFHPEFASNGYFYLNYTRNSAPGETVVARYRISNSDANRADPDSETIILTIAQDFANHNGGDIHFGPDGYLYIGMGDGGGSGDPRRRGQDLNSLLGKMLRIDVNGQSTAIPGSNELCAGGGNYAIPPGNPFARSDTETQAFVDGFETVTVTTRGSDGICDEIWSVGLRNPWRWSFDRQTGELIIGDVGQNAVEEISYQPAGQGGLNFGWPCREGNRAFGSPPSYPECQTPSPSFSEPILTYDHGAGDASVTGGYRYRGGYAPLAGRYFYADYLDGRIWIAQLTTDGRWRSALWQDTDLNVSTFGEDERGELYLADYGAGTIYRIATP